MEEIVISKDQLVDMFMNGDIKDTNEGWLYKNIFIVNIIAIHDKDPKYIYDVTNSEYYKISPIK